MPNSYTTVNKSRLTTTTTTTVATGITENNESMRFSIPIHSVDSTNNNNNNNPNNYYYHSCHPQEQEQVQRRDCHCELESEIDNEHIIDNSNYSVCNYRRNSKTANGNRGIFFGQLPKDVLFILLSFCDMKSNLSLSLCCRDLYEAASRNEIWIIILSREITVNKRVNEIFRSYHRKAKDRRLNPIETELMKKTDNEFLKFIPNTHYMEEDAEYLNEEFSNQVQYRMHEAIEDQFTKNVNYKKQYVDLLKSYSEAVAKRRMRRQEKIKRQNRLFSVGSITFLLFLFVGILLMVLLGLYLDNVIPQKGPYWAIPYTFIFFLVIIGVSCMTVGFAIAIRWNPIAHQNYFKTLSKHTKNYFTLSLAHFWWIPLLVFLLGIKMICDRYSHNWSLYMIPVYCSWFISIGLNFILAITVSREQKIEIQHLKNIIGESNSIRRIKKIGRALDCANAKISSSRLLCFTLTLSYICMLVTTALSLHKYDSVTQHNPTIKAGYTLLFIPVFFMLLCWIFLFPVIIKHIVYILLGSPTPVPMDFFQFARFVQVVLTSMCAEVIIIPIFVSTVLFALRLDGYITTHFIWVLSPVFFTFSFMFFAFGLCYFYIIYSFVKSKM